MVGGTRVGSGRGHCGTMVGGTRVGSGRGHCGTMVGGTRVGGERTLRDRGSGRSRAHRCRITAGRRPGRSQSAQRPTGAGRALRARPAGSLHPHGAPEVWSAPTSPDPEVRPCPSIAAGPPTRTFRGSGRSWPRRGGRRARPAGGRDRRAGLGELALGRSLRRRCGRRDLDLGTFGRATRRDAAALGQRRPDGASSSSSSGWRSSGSSCVGELRDRRAGGAAGRRRARRDDRPGRVYLAVQRGRAGARGLGHPDGHRHRLRPRRAGPARPRGAARLQLFLLPLAIVDDIGAIVVIAVSLHLPRPGLWLGVAGLRGRRPSTGCAGPGSRGCPRLRGPRRRRLAPRAARRRGARHPRGCRDGVPLRAHSIPEPTDGAHLTPTSRAEAPRHRGRPHHPPRPTLGLPGSSGWSTRLHPVVQLALVAAPLRPCERRHPGEWPSGRPRPPVADHDRRGRRAGRGQGRRHHGRDVARLPARPRGTARRAQPGRDVTGVAAIGGIGFTVSLLVTDLAFVDEALVAQARIGVRPRARRHGRCPRVATAGPPAGTPPVR